MLDKMRTKLLCVGINTWIEVIYPSLSRSIVEDDDLLEVKLTKDRNPNIVRSDENINKSQ